jgi:hypothetical protein
MFQFAVVKKTFRFASIFLNHFCLYYLNFNCIYTYSDQLCDLTKLDLYRQYFVFPLIFIVIYYLRSIFNLSHFIITFYTLNIVQDKNYSILSCSISSIYILHIKQTLKLVPLLFHQTHIRPT